MCLGNLKQIGQCAMVYAQDRANVYPIASGAEPAAYLSLQQIVDAGEYMKLDMFICPASQDTAAVRDASGRFTLDGESSSYAWVGEETLLTSRGDWALASDDSIRDTKKGIVENHDGGMNVVYVGTDAEWLPTDMLPEGFTLPKRLVDNEGRPGG